LFALSGAVGRGPLLDAGAYEAASAIDEDAARALVAALGARVAEWREPLAAFRAEVDLTRRALDWLLAAADRIGREGLPPAPAAGSRGAAIEAFYVRSAAWSSRDALGPLPLATALAVRAVRVWLARALAAQAPSDPRAAEPLALVEVVFRAAGLDAFVST
ncbi:MAG: hypothetical protein KF729_35805, partial [Sandaracinaceae bacterium]|nr:hypothetical protein [Sandaracinaceae bacterium]